MVLFILTIMVGLVIPKMWSQSDLKHSSRQLAGIIHSLFDESRSSKTLYRLHFNVREGSYWVTVLKGRQEHPVAMPLIGERHTLPSEVHFHQVLIGSQLRKGPQFMQFFPVGRVDPTVIQLTDDENVLSLVVHPLNGTVRIVKGNFVPKKWNRLLS